MLCDERARGAGHIVSAVAEQVQDGSGNLHVLEKLFSARVVAADTKVDAAHRCVVLETRKRALLQRVLHEASKAVLHPVGSVRGRVGAKGCFENFDFALGLRRGADQVRGGLRLAGHVRDAKAR